MPPTTPKIKTADMEKINLRLKLTSSYTFTLPTSGVGARLLQDAIANHIHHLRTSRNHIRKTTAHMLSLSEDIATLQKLQLLLTDQILDQSHTDLIHTPYFHFLEPTTTVPPKNKLEVIRLWLDNRPFTLVDKYNHPIRLVTKEDYEPKTPIRFRYKYPQVTFNHYA